MARFAIGDVQGCYDALRRLLDAIDFSPAVDTLWFTGDLVNRGSRSLDVVRFVMGMNDRACTVLGNHDLHLLAVSTGVKQLSSRDTFHDVLEAPDREEILAWLRARPLLHAEGRDLLVHAGLLPQWSVALAKRCAQEVEEILRGPRWTDLLHNMYGDEPRVWSDDLRSWDRLRLIVNAFTRLRFCDADGRADYTHKGAPGSQPPQLVPWFNAPDRRTRDSRVIFGHWSLLGRCDEFGVVGIDTGCAWGRELTAVRLCQAKLSFVSVDCGDGCKAAAGAAQ